ncbi:MAG: IS91 family transposase [Acidobacteriia bacterium]|nr:IS91 family transposase [Terriglobia bacterium]
MARRRLELADVVRAHRDDFTAYRGGHLAFAERRVLDDIASCRTAARGGHVERCDACGHERIAYNSCRNRHCPKCHELASARWLAARQEDVLPVEYFHVVFTIPHELGDIALQNKRVVYNLLFRASAETLLEIAADPTHLGAEIGFFSVLHTWGQTLEHHPHVHCLVPGGGLSPDQAGWVACQPRFFLSVRVLGRLFRGKFLHHLRDAFEHGTLGFHGRLEPLRERRAFRDYLAPLYRCEWNVYAKPPFGGPAQVLHYLARYAHRVAIANGRLRSLRDGRVTFVWKDYRHHGKKRLMTLSAVQFLRRFLLHLLPTGYVRIRHYGFLGNRCRREKLDRCRASIAESATSADAPTVTHAMALTDDPRQCPECRRGRMVCVLVFAPGDEETIDAWRVRHDTS